ncbi:urate hydroxylase PuuD [Frateuria defendens]|uniref:urate hydroxylase PuuD n=1 Tax=Frateuria defendens TaxID=2219559 RepID=UPI00066FC343|nr:urate hydroxylase PuuD [Frateuria defendens]
MSDYLMESIGLLLRWLHVIAAIAWIGESFYFVALDNGLEQPRPGSAPAGVAGESWSVHGGGFYHKQKYLVAPARMPETLHWSKWKAYTTWLSGFALFGAMYLSQPQLYLVDPAVAALPPHLAPLLAVAFLAGGWLVYDALCRLIGFRDGVLGVAVGLFVLAVDYAATHLFGGRAAFLLVGGVMATIMSANVFVVIIPGQKKMVAALARGETPDPVYGKRGKQRSVHNTYFTLPVVFAMLSNHYASTFAHPQAWLILALWMLAGALIRQFFVLWHAGRRAWALPAGGAVLIVAALAWMRPSAPAVAAPATPATTPASATAAPAVSADDFPLVQKVIAERCAGCHADHPTLMASAPKGLSFDNPQTILQHAHGIYHQTVQLKIMPLGNITHMSEAERATIARWYDAQSSKP